ncbi:high affinity copper uptake protein 1-like [Microplitis mediator]|uniref:high affinity copper uptake protein 1-like n=1 Tax=Microplitis mediator TaxID=375433 RepID=UPI0025527B01|nr:high affinity copper uptake protein 1-like [Microplitis mediator]
MMGMFFHFGVTESAIVFSGWKTSNWQGVLGSCIGIIILGIIYEGLKSYRESMFIKLSYLYQNNRLKKSRGNIILSPIHFYQTILHILQFTLGYLLMFIFMTYNVYFALAVMTGIGIGFWIFSWDRYNTNSQCCF